MRTYVRFHVCLALHAPLFLLAQILFFGLPFRSFGLGNNNNNTQQW